MRARYLSIGKNGSLESIHDPIDPISVHTVPPSQGLRESAVLRS